MATSFRKWLGIGLLILCILLSLVFIVHNLWLARLVPRPQWQVQLLLLSIPLTAILALPLLAPFAGGNGSTNAR